MQRKTFFLPVSLHSDVPLEETPVDVAALHPDTTVLTTDASVLDVVINTALGDRTLSACAVVWAGHRAQPMSLLVGAQGSTDGSNSVLRGPVLAALQFVLRTYLSSSPHRQMRVAFQCAMSNGKGKVTDLFKTITQEQVGPVTHPMPVFDAEASGTKYLYFSSDADVLALFSRLTQSVSFQRIQSKLSYAINVQCLRGPSAVPTQLLFVEVHPDTHTEVAGWLMKGIEPPTPFIAAALRMRQQNIVVCYPNRKLQRPPADLNWSDVVAFTKSVGSGMTTFPSPGYATPRPVSPMATGLDLPTTSLSIPARGVTPAAQQQQRGNDSFVTPSTFPDRGTDNSLLVEQGVSRRLRERAQQLEDQVRVLMTQRDGAEVELAKFKRDLASLRQRLAQNEDDAVRGQRGVNKLQVELDATMEEKRELESHNQELEIQVDRVVQELRRERTVFQQRAHVLQETEVKNRQLDKQLQDSESRVMELTAIMRRLENEKEEKMRSMRTREEALLTLQESALQMKLKFDCEMSRVKELHSAELHNQRREVEDAQRTIERTVMTQRAVWEQEAARARRDADIKLKALEDERREIMQSKECGSIELTEARSELVSAQERMQLLNSLLNDAGVREKDEKTRTDRLRNELDEAQQTGLKLKHDFIFAAQKLHEATVEKEQAQHNARHVSSKESQLEHEKGALRLEIKELEIRCRNVFYERETDRAVYEERVGRRAVEFDECRDDASLKVMEMEMRGKARNRINSDDIRSKDFSTRHKLTALEQQMEDYRDRAASAEGQLKALQDQLEERSRAHRAEVLDLQSIVTKASHERDRRALTVKEMHELQHSVEDDLQRARHDLAEARKQLHMLTSEKVALQSALCIEREGKLTELSDVRSKLEDLVSAQADREHDVAVRKDDEIREVGRLLEVEGQRRLEVQRQVEYLEQARDALHEDVSKHQKREKDLRRELAACQATVQKLSKELGERDATISQIQMRMGKLHALRDDLQSREQHILQDRDIRERQIECEFSAQRKIMEKRVEELEAERGKLKAQIEELAVRLDIATSAQAETEAEGKAARTELRNAMEIIDRLETTLTRERTTARAQEGGHAERTGHVESEAARLRVMLAAANDELERLRINRHVAAVTAASASPNASTDDLQRHHRALETKMAAIHSQNEALRVQRDAEYLKLADTAMASGDVQLSNVTRDARMKVVSHDVEDVRKRLDGSAASAASRRTDATISEARRRLIDARGALQSILQDGGGGAAGGGLESPSRF